MGFLRSFGRFWYDLVIGDDWKIAAAVAAALAVLLAVVRLRLLDDDALAVFGGLVIVVGFVISVVVDARDRER